MFLLSSEQVNVLNWMIEQNILSNRKKKIVSDFTKTFHWGDY